jgi:uncharacterized protein YbjT (DUF2867 family)
MRVLVTGAYGLIGAACLTRLHRDGHGLIGAGRKIDEARRRFPFAAWRVADFDRLTTPESWTDILAGVDAVVNCVGVLQDGVRDDVRRVQLDATAALFEACARAGVRRVVHISAVGAQAEAPTAFARTKASAEERLAQLDLDWAILRPALVLAPAAYGGTALLRALAAMPGVILLSQPQSRMQIVSVEDVADAVASCLSSNAATGVRWDIAHPQMLSLAETVAAMRQWLGLAPARIVAVPAALGHAVARIADLLGWLGWRAPLRTAALAQLDAGVVGDPRAWIAARGRAPMSLADILAARSANVQERWFARVYLVKPLAIGGLALFWIATGLIALGPSRAAAVAVLTDRGVSSAAATVIALGGALVDIALGLAVAVRRFTRAALIGMLVVTGIYLLGASALLPALWLDPLGPLVKTLPLVLAVLFTLAILDER